MSILQDFTSKDMIEQITILDELSSSGRGEDVEGLMEIYAQPLADLAVDEMVYHTLSTLLAKRRDYILEGFEHPAKRVRLLCIKQSGESGLAAARDRLAGLLQTAGDDLEVVTECVRSLAKLQGPEIVDILLPYLNHDDPTVAGLALETVAGQGGSRGRDAILAYITAAEADQTDTVSIGLGLAFTTLGRFSDDKTIEFLATHIHNQSPTLRKIVHEQLIAIGEQALPFLEKVLTAGDKDEKIMAANVVGLIGHKNGANILTDLLDQPGDLEPNLTFAAYEALGRIPSMRSIVGLTDGLAETDEMLLIAVLTALNNLCTPGVARPLQESLEGDADQRLKILRSLVATKSGKLFELIWNDDRYLDELTIIIATSNDADIRSYFSDILAGSDDPKAAKAIEQISSPVAETAGKHILAADDSKAMLYFYSATAAEMNLKLTTAEDGLQALNLLKTGQSFDLLITDLNMPNMDGVELVNEIRTTLKMNIPILMASTESERSQTELARKAGVSDFITKPFTRREFMEKVNTLCS